TASLKRLDRYEGFRADAQRPEYDRIVLRVQPLSFATSKKDARGSVGVDAWVYAAPPYDWSHRARGPVIARRRFR
ncbi:MAG: hypothetical protein AAFR23_07285, partial [Pseudomonadota bacterium]